MVRQGVRGIVIREDVGGVTALREGVRLVSIKIPVVPPKSRLSPGSLVDECLCLHAEENALLEAGRERIGDDAVLYCNTWV